MNENELRKILGRKVREIRKKTKLTQQQLAEKIGVYQTDLSAFESRGEKIGMEKISAIFECLGFEVKIGYDVQVSEKKTALLSW